MKKVVISIILILASFTVISYTLSKNKAKNEAATQVVAQKNAAVVVRTAIAEKKSLDISYKSNGVFEPKQEVMISAQSQGRVVKVLVEEGSYVKAGQTLAIIEADKQNVNVSNAQAVYENAKNEVARFETAYQTGGVTKQQLDQVKLQLENAKNNLKSAQIVASDVNVKASFAGIVNKRNIEPGAFVNPGTQLFEIVNTSTLKLRVNVDEKNIGSVKLGQKVKITAQSLADQSWTGEVIFIAPKADASLNFPVEIEIKNNGTSQLRAGMYGTAQFGSGMAELFVVPKTAFVGNVSSNQIFVVKDGKAQLVNVVSGKTIGDYVEIYSGLENGQEVVTAGQINLYDNTPVEVIK